MATLYFNAAVDTSLDTLGNWWTNQACTTPASAVPTTGDIAEILATYASGSLTADRMNVRGSTYASMDFSNWGGTLNVQEFHYYDTSTTAYYFGDKDIYFHDQSSLTDPLFTSGNGYYWWCVDGVYSGGLVNGKVCYLCSNPDNTYGIDNVLASSFAFNQYSFTSGGLTFNVPASFTNGAGSGASPAQLYIEPVTIDVASASTYILNASPDIQAMATFYGGLTITSSGGASKSKLLLNEILRLPFPITL